MATMAMQQSYHQLGVWAPRVAVTSVVAFVLYLVGSAVYNLYFHPLAKFPGPRLWAISRIPYAINIRNGRMVFRAQEFHNRYNSHVVRVAPNELFFTDGAAWRDAYQRHGRHQQEPAFQKHDAWLRPMVNGAWSLLHAPDADHARYKRLLNHAFSEKALRGQEKFVQEYVDLLVRRLKESIEAGENMVDIVKWYSWTVFDIIGDLTFGEPFDCLKEKESHPWVTKLFTQFRGATALAACRYFPGLEKLLEWSLPKSVMKMRWELFRRCQEKIERRLSLTTDRLDLIHYVQRHNDEKGMTRDEIDATFTTLSIAGGETTSSMISAATYFLIQNPDAWNKVAAEIRGAFETEKDMTDAKLDKLPYFGAVTKEVLRMAPPLTFGHPRVVPQGGRTVAGHWLPEGTVVSVVAWAASRSPLNFADPDKFEPERWLKYNGYDDASAFQPFGMGPRNCIGRQLGLLGFRHILGRMIWNFDIRVPGSGTEVPWDWSTQNVYISWDRRPLFVELKVAERGVPVVD